MKYSLVPIVEGHGEVESIPILMRRILNELNQHNVKVEKAVRVKRNQVTKQGELERRILLAMTRPNCKAIMVILDADDDCPKELGPELLQRAGLVAKDILVSVVLPKSELESWFVGSIESLRGVRGISSDACSPSNIEEMRDAKGFLDKSMQSNRHYIEVADQPAFAEKFDLIQSLRNCRSFKKFHEDFLRILVELKS